MSEKTLKPEIIVFAGPNGSGKSTITKLAKTVGVYINADDIKRTNHCTDIEAAQKALRLIPELISVCDILHIYDNTVEPTRIFKKRKTKYFRWENVFWPEKEIEKLTGIKDYETQSD